MDKYKWPFLLEQYSYLWLYLVVYYGLSVNRNISKQQMWLYRKIQVCKSLVNQFLDTIRITDPERDV